MSALRSVKAVAVKAVPFVLAAGLLAGTVFFALNCGGTTVAFRDGARVASLAVEVADTPEKRALGLSGRRSLSDGHGMLFDFGGEVDIAFTMEDTSIPLSIAFVDSDGIVIAVRDMEPFDPTPVTSPREYRYAIEANRSWFESNGVKPGTSAVLDAAP